MAKLPAFQMYPGDWMKDPALRACSVAARGLWMDMLCLMFECDRRGYLSAPNGKPFSLDQLARMTGCSTEEVSRLVEELETSGVFSRTKDGTIFSRRQIRDEERRADGRARVHKHRNSHKTKENSNADVTHDVTRLKHHSSSSTSVLNTPPSRVREDATPNPPGIPDSSPPPPGPLRPVNPDAGGEMQAAVWLFEELAVPCDFSTRTLAAEAIRLQAAEWGGIEPAARRILAAAKDAKAGGETRWRFWFQDSGYIEKTATATAPGGSRGTSQPSATHQRVSANKRALAEALARRGIDPSCLAPGANGRALPEPRPD